MEWQARGRSPSTSLHNNQHIKLSPSPHNFHGQVSQPENSPSGRAYSAHPFPSNDLSLTNNINYNLRNSYLNSEAQERFQSLHNFDPSYQHNGLDVNARQLAAQQTSQYQPDMLNVDTRFGDFPHQQGFNKQELLLDPQLGDHSINPADLMSNMSSPQNLVPTPPNYQMNAKHSEPTSPFTHAPHQNAHYSPNHSRHTSLDPTAAYANGQPQDWTSMMEGPQFQGHRRTPSEYSDVSSSNAPSPYINQGDGFEGIDHAHSPLLNPQPDNNQLYDSLGIGSVNISDPPHGQSPRHSPYVSPHMSPQAEMGQQQPPFMSLPENQNNFNNALMPEAYAGAPTEQFPTFKPEQRLPSNDFGRADQYDVPQINVESAPNPQQFAMDNARSPTDIDALSPPDRGRRRGRAKSDTHIPRSATPSSTAVNIGSPDPSIPPRQTSLSPFDVGFSPHSSRPTSPTPRSSSQRRSSTSSIPNRDYFLELADPSRPPAPGTEKGRIQKHPATFSCHLCSKKFTRAYNLRSHLRTHTDERPFVCTVCSKAFARQHDRKRHEGLHSGEKKFVCRGELSTGAQWGCGRRFARADALGRHFRSEAGRVCIKPLLDEEADERQRMNEHRMAQNMAGGIAPQAGMNKMPIQQQFAFPAALLQQFPALQGLQWDTLPNGAEEDDFSGRSSFDASSGGDFYDDEDAGSGYKSDNPIGRGLQQGVGWQDQGWKSDIES